MIYIMNSAVMPAGNFGTYTYEPATLADLQNAIASGQYQSCIGYPQNIDLIEQWTGTRIELSRDAIQFKNGDKAIVMRLKQRVANPATKGAPVSPDPGDWEFALVTFSE